MSNGSIGRRLIVLEERRRPKCGECWWWSADETVLCDQAGTCTRPERCASCGKIVAIRDRAILAGVDLSRL